MTQPNKLPELPRLKPLEFAVFDEFGKGADDRVMDYARAHGEAVAAMHVPQQWQDIATAPKDMGTYMFLCNGVALQGFMDATGALCVCLEAGASGNPPWRRMRRSPTHWAPRLAAPGAAPVPAVSAAARDVLAERQRQISVEGWTPEHDDEHSSGELALAAACYALVANQPLERKAPMCPGSWPWRYEWWKPSDRRRDLIKAGALILAEIERLDRAAALKGNQQ